MKKMIVKNLGRVVTGNTPSMRIPEFYNSKDISFIKPGEINIDGVTPLSTAKNYISEGARNKARIVGKDSILVTCIGNIGKVGIVISDEISFNQQINAIIPNHLVLPRYLAYNLVANQQKLSAIANAPVVPQVNKTQFENFDIEVHENKQDQKKIVNVLDRLSKVLDSKSKQLLEYDNLIKSRFVEMFGDPILNEMNWGIYKWNEVLTIKNGKNQKKVINPEGQYPICGSGGIMGYADDYLCNENSVIIGRKGSINKPILMNTKYWNVDTAFGLEPKKDRLLVNYLYMFCEFYDFIKHNKAVTIPSLTKGDLLKVDMPIPPIHLQNQFAKFVEQVDKLKFEVMKH